MNALSMLGRMNYGGTMIAQTLVVGGGIYGYNIWSAHGAAKQAEEDKDNLPTLKTVDPDLFNPFTAIPFHNNPELKYRFANMKMHGYLDPKTHLNLKDYSYKGFHDSYDHSDKKQHYYNWISVVPSHNA